MLHNLPNIPPSTSSRSSSTTRTSFAPLAENRRGSVCHQDGDIPDNGGLLFFEVLETEQKQAQLSYLDAPPESDVALPGSRIMT